MISTWGDGSEFPTITMIARRSSAAIFLLAKKALI
jgi:hypothetical protein